MFTTGKPIWWKLVFLEEAKGNTPEGEFPDLEGDAWGPKVGGGEWEDHVGKLLGLCSGECHVIAAFADPLCVVGKLCVRYIM